MTPVLRPLLRPAPITRLIGWLAPICLLLAVATIAAAEQPTTHQPPTGEPLPLGFNEAVIIALEAGDPLLDRAVARAAALGHDAVAAAQLPDPMVSAQIANVPVDSFGFNNDGMTQALRLGLRQEFPPGNTRSMQRRQLDTEAEVERSRWRLTRRQIALATRQAWLELAWQGRAIELLTQSRQAIGQHIEALQSGFAAGRLHAQSLLRAELELALLDDRMAEFRRQADLARADLARHIGRSAFRPLPDSLPDPAAQALGAALEKGLVEHPAVVIEQTRIAAADLAVDLAEQAYKPRLALEAGYGLRVDRADLASIGLTMSVPLFTGKRQDRRRTAAIERSHAAQSDRDAVLLDLRRQLDRATADWQRYRERLELYRQVVSQRASETAEAALVTYANGQTDFAEWIGGELAELDALVQQTRLQALAIEAWARIVYLVGESS